MKHVVVGVSGGIAAYKAADVVSRLVKENVEVRVAMTKNATRFVTPLTFASLSGHPVLIDDLVETDASIPHIAWARWADLVLIAPTTANTLARLAHGFADEALTALVLALEPNKAVLLAPAMNTRMWENPLVQRNLETLRALDAGQRFDVIDPVSKRLACGEEGLGALAAPERIVEAVLARVAATR
ncbi:MAG: phosphopantothenoylcysteine decarboxylase [Planctomycetes bacterium]|nr:phosphopantothenoylcysteine decarboxylase [Planctomycetota bacterium]MCC7170967.1 phosphopantothenoylcysteine decarboxylase [Planctomycetota bacterium]